MMSALEVGILVPVIGVLLAHVSYELVHLFISKRQGS